MTWSDVCSTYTVYEKSLEKKAPNHASMNKFGITWQAFSVLRVLQPIFFSQEYSTLLSNVCGILDMQQSLTIQRFQYLQVLADECSTAMLKQLPQAFQDSAKVVDLSGKNPKKETSFPNKGQIRQVFSSELLKHLLLAYTMPKPSDDNMKFIENAINAQTYQPTILQNIWGHLHAKEKLEWIRIVDKALFYYIEYLVDFCRVNSFRELGMPFIGLLAKKSPLYDGSLRFDDKANIFSHVHLPKLSNPRSSAKPKYTDTDRFKYAMSTGLFENIKQAQTVKMTPSTDKKKKRIITVPVSFEACMKQIIYQALHSEKDTDSSTDQSNWWNFFNISGFVEEIEDKASTSIFKRHQNLESHQKETKNTQLIITEGCSRKRMVEQMVASFDSLRSKRHKTDIFEKTLSMLAEVNSSDNGPNKEKITAAEVVTYKEIMELSSARSKPTVNNDSNSSDDSSSDSSTDGIELL